MRYRVVQLFSNARIVIAKFIDREDAQLFLDALNVDSNSQYRLEEAKDRWWL